MRVMHTGLEGYAYWFGGYMYTGTGFGVSAHWILVLLHTGYWCYCRLVIYTYTFK